MRWAETLNATTFLVDQHENIVSANGVSRVADQALELIGIGGITGEYDQPAGLGGAQKIAFPGGQLGTGQAGNEGACHPLGLSRP